MADGDCDGDDGFTDDYEAEALDGYADAPGVTCGDGTTYYGLPGQAAPSAAPTPVPAPTVPQTANPTSAYPTHVVPESLWPETNTTLCATAKAHEVGHCYHHNGGGVCARNRV